MIKQAQRLCNSNRPLVPLPIKPSVRKPFPDPFGEGIFFSIRTRSTPIAPCVLCDGKFPPRDVHTRLAFCFLSTRNLSGISLFRLFVFFFSLVSVVAQSFRNTPSRFIRIENQYLINPKLEILVVFRCQNENLFSVFRSLC